MSAARGPVDVVTRVLTPALWPDLERLFGKNGACGGCWCMSWRHEKGEKWDAVKGATNRARFHDLVHNDRAHGVLAYVDNVPVGWCAFDRRVEFVKLHRAPSFACDDGEQVWSLPCFFIKAGMRGQGVSGALLAAALVELQARGAVVVEGYPVQPDASGKPTPAAFAWTGTRSLFAKAGFVPVGKTDGGKQRMRKTLA